MGSKLAILAAQLILVGGASLARAQKPADLVRQGIELYKAGKYEEAAAVLEKAYDREPKVETLFALAQAERLAGKCDQAIPHYRKLLEQTTEIATAKAIQNNLELCPEAAPPPPEPAAAPAPAPAPPPPPPKTITVMRDVERVDGLGVTLLAAGALGGGLAGGLALRSSSTRDDAASARTLDDANRLHDRADRDRLVAMVVGGASAVALGVAVVRLARGGKRSSTRSSEVAVVPTGGGSMLVLARRW